ncbi:3-hydroxyisobutyrate dehydrogenase [Marinicella pacifica]|uniref:3-hydroxyisobutyrate dehydrogenase n=1 Tax=Marinicella pacifica TaxID=1171543 RepID=A0A917CVY5_9GAMM|nr:NAD(P)-dependent oxidoreductase [Marinicella pacifica]GGG00137.1 3-hydroxyisobutyrate dehydrogenase [Marinicella pacifica]
MSLDKLNQVVVYGLGAMGRPMARNLHKQNLLLGVKNRTRGKAQAMEKELNLTSFENDAVLFGTADCVLTCVSADNDLKAIISNLIPHMKPGSVVIDCSTVSPQTAQSISDDLAANGIVFLDAPVSGGVEGAKKGSLSIMVGGDRQTYKRAADIFSAIGSQITHMGKVGQGQATKAVNQVMVAGVAQAVCSSLAMAEQCKLDVKKVVEVLSAGAAGNWFLENRGQTMIKDEFNIGFKLDLLLKDLHICQSTLNTMDASLPLVQASIEDYKRLSEAGYGDEDISALIRLKRCELNHEDLPRESDNDA